MAQTVNPAAYFNRGMCLIELGNKKEGCGDLVRAGKLGSIYSYEQGRQTASEPSVLRLGF